MVKFSFFALATALATSVNAGSSAVRRETTIKLGNRTLRRGDPATEALLQKARLYKKGSAATDHRRRLEGEDFEIDGSYNLKFSQCVDIKTYDEDLFDENIVSYVQAGQVISTKSYVLFHVCQGDNCYYESDDDLYIVDLPTYLTNVATYHANKRNDYCEMCEEFDDYCNAEEEEAADEEAADEGEEEAADDEAADGEEGADEEEDAGAEEDANEEDAEGEGEQEEGQEGEQNDGDQERKLKKKGRKLNKKDRKLITRKLAKQYIDCDQCATYECYVDYDEMDDGVVRRDELDEEVSNWIADLSECKESGVQWNGLDLYLGAMCSPYGDGVELAVFVNEDCTMYTNQQSFYSVFDPYNDSENGVNYLTYAEEFIKSAFSGVTSCLQQKFDDPDEEEDDAADDDAEQEYEVNDYCQQVMEGDVAAFNNCAADEDQGEEDNDDQYNWYTYDVKEADDVNQVCYALNQLSGEYSYIYDEEASGTWYNRNKNGQIVDNNYIEAEGGVMSPGIIAVIVSVCVIVIAGAAFLLKPKKKPSDSNEPVYQGGTML